jgi:hypothetical protein
MEKKHCQPKIPLNCRQKYQLPAVPQNAANQKYTVEPGTDVYSAHEYATNTLEKTCYEQRTGNHPQQWTEQCGSSLHVTREYTASKDLQRHNATDLLHGVHAWTRYSATFWSENGSQFSAIGAAVSTVN